MAPTLGWQQPAVQGWRKGLASRPGRAQERRDFGRGEAAIAPRKTCALDEEDAWDFFAACDDQDDAIPLGGCHLGPDDCEDFGEALVDWIVQTCSSNP